jgi:hypothetical protein
MENFVCSTELNFAVVRAKTGRSYYINPYYFAAWSNVFQERLISNAILPDDIFLPSTHEELKAFLMAIYPPQLRITETNIAVILIAACKMESYGLLRKCAQMLLSSTTQLSVFVRLSLLDRCKMFDLLDQCLQMVQRPEHIMEMSQQQTYECLSTRAKAAMMDRFTSLTHRPGMLLHNCLRCKAYSSCQEVVWQCPQCKTHSNDPKLLQQQQQQMQQQQMQQQQSQLPHQHSTTTTYGYGPNSQPQTMTGYTNNISQGPTTNLTQPLQGALGQIATSTASNIAGGFNKILRRNQ